MKKNPAEPSGAKPEDPNEEYDPFAHREVQHPTSDFVALMHLLKGCLGSGILAMAEAYANAGLIFGFCGTLFVAATCAYAVHILVKSAHELCKSQRIPSLDYSEVAETAFACGPLKLRDKKYGRTAKFLVNAFLVLDLLGCCCVYLIFVAENIKQVVDYYTAPASHKHVRIYMAIILPFLLVSNFVRHLKFLAPFSSVANMLVFVSIGIVYYYLLRDAPPFSSRSYIVSPAKMPKFFGIAIFALEGIGVVMPLENSMAHPTHFIGCPSVLNIAMSVVATFYALTGFLGYARYGPDTEDSITLNLPEDEGLGQSVKIMIAIAMFCTYVLVFYVPMEIIWKCIGHHFTERPLFAEYCLRVILVLLTSGIAILVPDLGNLISLIGAVCLSFLGLIFPAIIETLTYYEKPGLKLRFAKNVLLILFGIFGFFAGTYVSLQGIIENASYRSDYEVE